MGTVDDLAIFREMRRIEDPLALWHFAAGCLRERGAKSIIYHRYVGLGPGQFGKHGIKVLAQDVPQDWLRSYILDKTFLNDPLPYFARLAGRPFFWSEIEGQMRLTPEQSACLQAQRQAGMTHGVGMHILGPEIRDAYLGFAIDEGDTRLTETEIMAWQSIVQMAHLRGCALRETKTKQALDLAPREREILQWIARGKSNAMIARILNISPHTIDTLVRRVFDKLDVTDRTSAAIKGIGLGQVLLN